VLPALGVIWRPDPHWSVGLTFPRASIAYAPTTRWLFTLSASPGGAGWNIKDPATVDNVRLNYKSWRAALGAEHQFAQSGPAKFWLFVAGGWQFGQEIQFENDDLTLFESDLEDGQFVSGGLRMRF
jgi:hypothetical protein